MANSAYNPTTTLADGSVTESKLARGAHIVSGTEQASTSGTAIDFTGIPAGVKRITISFFGVSTDGGSPFNVQLGDAGGIEATGYAGSTINIASGDLAGSLNSTGFEISQVRAAIGTYSGHITLILEDATNFTWGFSCVVGRDDTAGVAYVGSGHKSLSAELTQLRFTTLAGDTFDAGALNITYE